MSEQLSKIWLSPPHMGGTEQLYVNDAFANNWIAPLGSNVTGFENDLEHYLGSNKKVAALSSGTAALHLALVLLGVEQGQEVLCQSFTFAASVNPVVYTGATPVFVDSEPQSWNMSPVHLEAAIKDRLQQGSKPAAIIAVHLYGMPYKHEEISAIAKRYNMPLIEDAAEALGSSWQGQPCGTLADLAVLSFNGNKIITTSGGGALVCTTNELKERAVFFATQAKDNAPHYEHTEVGYNYRLSNICAGIGRGQMEVLSERVAQKRALHNKYAAFFSGKDGVTLFTEYATGVVSNHWLNCIVFNAERAGGKSARGLAQALEAQNIESRPLWKPMHLQPVYANYPYYGGKVAEELFKNGLCLPSGTGMSYEQEQRIFSCLEDYFV